MKKEVTVNPDQLRTVQNRHFIHGSFVGNRKKIAYQLSRVFNFPGGYRAAYRAVKRGYAACNLYAGPALGGGYVLNCF